MSEKATLDEFIGDDDGVLSVEPQGVRLALDESYPKEWGFAELEKVCEVNSGFTWNKEQETDSSEDDAVPVIKIGNVQDGYLDLDDVLYLTGVSDEDLRENKARKDWLLMIGSNGSGERVGHCGIIEEDMEFVYASFLYGLHADSDYLLPRFLFYSLNRPKVQQRLTSFTAGSTSLKNLNKSTIENLSIPTPPLSEQRKIATVLRTVDRAIEKTGEIISQTETIHKGYVQGLFESEQLSEIDRTESEEKRIESILRSRREVWAEAEKERQQRKDNFDGDIDESKYSQPLDVATKRLPELPDGWLWTSLDTFVAYDIDYRGMTPPYSDSGIPVISSGNIQDGEIVFDDEKYVSEETYDDWLDRGVPKEDDLLITTEAPVGKVTLYPEGTYLPTRRIITFRTVGVENRYLQAAIRHPYVQNYLTAQSGGSTVGRILKDHLLKTPIPLPPKEEQAQITGILKDFDKRISKESEYNSRLKRLKRGLMQDLLSGKVRTTDNNIEVPEEIA